MVTALLVDDMPQALEVLENDLRAYCPNIEIIGKAGSVVQAAKELRTKEPDIIFLDILLGDGTGFDLLEIFPSLNSKLIFVTATDEYAIKAFRFAAIDYLLKPIDAHLLQEAVKKATDLVQTNSGSIDILKETINHPNRLPQRISLHSQDKISIVEIEKIIRCESDGNNTIFHLENGEQLYVTKTLKSYDEMFRDHSFMRVHQSHLVNLKFIHEYIRRDGGYLKMTNGDNVSVSLRKKTEVIQRLDNL